MGLKGDEMTEKQENRFIGKNRRKALAALHEKYAVLPRADKHIRGLLATLACEPISHSIKALAIDIYGRDDIHARKRIKASIAKIRKLYGPDTLMLSHANPPKPGDQREYALSYEFFDRVKEVVDGDSMPNFPLTDVTVSLLG